MGREGARRLGFTHHLNSLSHFTDSRKSTFILAEFFSQYFKDNSKIAFTLAEVLITLGIIGIVASMTMPTLIAKYQKQETVVKLKKAYNILSRLVLQSHNDNGDVALSGGVSAEIAEKFFKTYWFPYLKGPGVSPEGKYPYGEDYAYKYRSGETRDVGIFTNYSAGRIFFTTADGLAYYVNIMDWDYHEEGKGIPATQHFSTKQTIHVDVNGIKPPNTFGKDVFLFRIDFDKNIVRGYSYKANNNSVKNDCSISGKGEACSEKIIRDGWEIKDDYPW